MLVSEATAISVRNAFENVFKFSVPSLTRMSVRPVPLGAGLRYYIEVGVRHVGSLTAPEALFLRPFRLAGRGIPIAATMPVKYVDMTLVSTGNLQPMASPTYPWEVEPVRGGHAVCRSGQSWGTLGCLMRMKRNGSLDTANTYFLSSWHVLSGQTISPGYEIRWPPGSGFSKRVGELYWSVLNGHLDAAIGVI